MTVRAIETSYRGYRFRSRLEARWAVFFDSLRLVWEYEPQGYEFDSGDRYLPDFWLPTMNLWVEIKPVPLRAEVANDAGRDRREVRVLEALRNDRCAGVMFGGNDPSFVTAWCGADLSDGSGGASAWWDAAFTIDDSGEPNVWVDGYGEREFFNGVDSFTFPCATEYRTPPRLMDAVYAFRSARFEYGECPTHVR